MRIALDLMGSELAPKSILQALIEVKRECPNCTLVGVSDKFYWKALPKEKDGFDWVECQSFISMEASPLLAIRRQKHSSMAVGIQLLKDKKVDAFVSMGNTGALVALAILHLQLLPNVSRPALMALLPTESGRVAVLDVGAHVTFAPEHLLDFARIGVAFRQAERGIDSPSIGLLNIGEENAKGTKLMKEGYGLLASYFKDKPTSFFGNIEGREVFHGCVDVLVTDGFTGNVFLKTCEGASAFLLDYLNDHFSSRISPMLGQLHKQFNYAEHPGALVGGLDGLVIKCHGYSNQQALISGLRGAIDLVSKNIIPKMRESLISEYK